MAVEAPKNPVKQRAGLISARKRWGDTPRVARLDELTAPQRRLVLALIEAAKAERRTGTKPPKRSIT